MAVGESPGSSCWPPRTSWCDPARTLSRAITVLTIAVLAPAVLTGCSDQQIDRFLRDVCGQRADCDVHDARPEYRRGATDRARGTD